MLDLLVVCGQEYIVIVHVWYWWRLYYAWLVL